jgi:hypothetical protein
LILLRNFAQSGHIDAFRSIVGEVQPVLAFAKHRTGKALRSRALMADAKETFVCSYLSLSLLAGLGLNAFFGWWWADPIAALTMLPFVLHERLGGDRGSPRSRARGLTPTPPNIPFRSDQA